jgi:hypothetical protein
MMYVTLCTDGRVHLMLLQYWRRSPTDAILECRTDMHTAVSSMCFPNADNKTWHENKWRGIVEQQYEIHHFYLCMSALEYISLKS